MDVKHLVKQVDAKRLEPAVTRPLAPAQFQVMRIINLLKVVAVKEERNNEMFSSVTAIGPR